MQKLSYVYIYLTMTSDDVETSYISFANICVKNFSLKPYLFNQW